MLGQNESTLGSEPGPSRDPTLARKHVGHQFIGKMFHISCRAPLLAAISSDSRLPGRNKEEVTTKLERHVRTSREIVPYR